MAPMRWMLADISEVGSCKVRKLDFDRDQQPIFRPLANPSCVVDPFKPAGIEAC